MSKIDSEEGKRIERSIKGSSNNQFYEVGEFQQKNRAKTCEANCSQLKTGNAELLSARKKTGPHEFSGSACGQLPNNGGRGKAIHSTWGAGGGNSRKENETNGRGGGGPFLYLEIESRDTKERIKSRCQ